MTQVELQRRTVDDLMLSKFAGEVDWWDPNGVARWLHRYNAVRVPYIRDAACRKFQRDPSRADCLAGVRILEVGCGAGLLCEPLAHLGATVIGVDPTSKAIEMAREHARQSGAAVEYRCDVAERLIETGERFDVVVSMEVIEHVAEWPLFLEHCSALLRPEGLLILSTINRTVKSYLFAILLAEYVLMLLPRGTHRWSRFVRPQEIAATLTRNRMNTVDVTGVTFDVLRQALQLSTDDDVNFMLTAEATPLP